MIHQQQIIGRATKVSFTINIGLSAFKVVIGFFTGSLGLFSDGVHSLSDVLSDIVVYISARMASKPPDSDHHFGHGQFETLGELILTGLLLIAAGGIVWYGLLSIYRGEMMHCSGKVILTASLSVVIKEWLFRWTKDLGRQYNSRLLLLNAWHHRSDAFSSLAVVIGAVVSFMGWGHADAVAGIVVGLFIALTAIKFMSRSFMDLMGKSPGRDMELEIKQIMNSLSEVRSFHKLRVRKLGGQIFMDMHLMVNPDLSLREAHEISTRVEQKMKTVFGETTNVLIHVEPYMERHSD